jgi:hypothetical protein
VKLSVAPVEMTFVCGWQTGEHATSKEEADPYGMTTKRANGKSKRKDKSKGKDKATARAKAKCGDSSPFDFAQGQNDDVKQQQQKSSLRQSALRWAFFWHRFDCAQEKRDDIPSAGSLNTTTCGREEGSNLCRV